MATGKRRYVDVLNFSNHLSILILIPIKLMIKNNMFMWYTGNLLLSLSAGSHEAFCYLHV